MHLGQSKTGFYKLFVRHTVVFLLSNSSYWLARVVITAHLNKYCNCGEGAFKGHILALFAQSGIDLGPTVLTRWPAQSDVGETSFRDVVRKKLRPCYKFIEALP